MKNHIQVGEIEIPTDYWQIDEATKKLLLEELVDTLLQVLDKQINPNLDKIRVLDHLLLSSIVTNEETENYEICQVLQDIRTLINE
jgi:hypothetical protein